MGKILIVEDEAEILEDLVSLVTEAGFESLLTASDGNSALSLILDVEIRLVISDISMPGLSGTDLLVKARSRGLEAPFAFISGNLSQENMLSAIRLGATDFIPKPFEADALIATVKRLYAIGEAKATLAELMPIVLKGGADAQEALEQVEALNQRISFLQITNRQVSIRKSA